MSKRQKSKKGNRVLQALLRDCPELCGPCKCRILGFMTQRAAKNAGYITMKQEGL